jgi:hypothetical protein
LPLQQVAEQGNGSQFCQGQPFRSRTWIQTVLPILGQQEVGRSSGCL